MAYIFRVWLITILLSPVLICLFLGALEGKLFVYFDIVILMVLFGTVFSIPTTLILLILSILLIKKEERPQTIKTFLSIITALGVIISFIIVPFNNAEFAAPFVYTVVMVTCIWMVKFPDYLSEEEP